MIEIKLTGMPGVRHPITSSGMMRLSRAELVTAVANADALGFLTALTQPTPDDLIREIERTRSMTDKPFELVEMKWPTEQLAYQAHPLLTLV